MATAGQGRIERRFAAIPSGVDAEVREYASRPAIDLGEVAK